VAVDAHGHLLDEVLPPSDARGVLRLAARIGGAGDERRGEGDDDGDGDGDDGSRSVHGSSREGLAAPLT